MQALQNIDRRIIYVLMMVVCIFALLKPMGLPISIGETTQMSYDLLQTLQPGDIVYLGFEFSAGGVPELVPSIKATTKLAFERGARIVSGAMWLEGQELGAAAVNEMANRMGKQYGTDYVHIGYRPGGQMFLELAVQDFWQAATGMDQAGTPLSQFPLMADFKVMPDATAIFIYCTGTPGERQYIATVGDRFGTPIVVACTSVSVPEVMPFVRSGQLKGLLMGMRGAAEFEILAGIPGSAVAGMDAQSLSHVLIIVFIALGNVAYLFGGKKGGRAR